MAGQPLQPEVRQQLRCRHRPHVRAQTGQKGQNAHDLRRRYPLAAQLAHPQALVTLGQTLSPPVQQQRDVA